MGGAGAGKCEKGEQKLLLAELTYDISETEAVLGFWLECETSSTRFVRVTPQRSLFPFRRVSDWEKENKWVMREAGVGIWAYGRSIGLGGEMD